MFHLYNNSMRKEYYFHESVKALCDEVTCPRTWRMTKMEHPSFKKERIWRCFPFLFRDQFKIDLYNRVIELQKHLYLNELMIHGTWLLKDKARELECLPPVTHRIWYWGYRCAHIHTHLTWVKSDSCSLWVAEDFIAWTTYSNKPVGRFSESVPGDKLRAVLRSFLFLMLIRPPPQ